VAEAEAGSPLSPAARFVFDPTTIDPERLQQELVQAQRMEAMGKLIGGIAHELNNPLASILAFSQLIRTDPQLPPDLHRLADLLNQESNRTRRIVQGLLDFARQGPPERVPTSPRELTDDVLALQSHSIGRGRIEAIVDIPEDIPKVAVDRAQIRQVLLNLTLNAAEAIRSRDERGTVTIRAVEAARADGEPVVRLAVTDDGPGVPPEIGSRIFAPFFTTKPAGEATGLGLPVSLAIALSHGGTLVHEPGPNGVGAAFILALPVRQVNTRQSTESGPAVSTTTGEVSGAASPSVAGPGAASPGAAGPGAASPSVASPGDASTHAIAAEAPTAGRPARVLVLDDEPSIRDFLARILRRNGYEPILAANGAAALEIVRTSPPDAILCDHRMAGMTGMAFHDIVSALEPRLARRFVLMSGDMLNAELQRFAADRGVRLLSKPFDIQTVSSVVAEVVRA
jgi:two-component system NtrC family sensor kinase